MERINQFEFFRLGEIIQPLKAISGDIDPNGAFFPIYYAHAAISRWATGDPLDLTISQACVERFRDALWTFIGEHFREKAAGGADQWKFPKVGDPIIPSWEWANARTALTEFETIFREEMREAAIYRVPQRGIFDTAKLVDKAEQSFPAELVMVIPDKTKEDWRAAGRCLAFNLLSASGFHVARAVEGMMESYYQAALGVAPSDKKGTLKSWNDYLVALEGAKTAAPAKATIKPSEKVISEFRQMKDDYRNPIAHPRIVLSEPDARMLFANGESLVIAMAQEMKAAIPAPVNALAGLGIAQAFAGKAVSETPKDADKLPDAEAEARFKRLVGNLVNTPHKPHKADTKEAPSKAK